MTEVVNDNNHGNKFRELISASRWTLPIKRSAPLLFLLCSPIQSLAATSRPTENTELETKVWISEDSRLPDLEKRVVREIQLNPGSAFYHYLLSHISLRLLALDPSDASLMEQATESAQQAVDLEPKSEYGYVALAELLDLTGHGEKGIALINEVRRSNMRLSWRINFLQARLSSDSASAADISNFFKSALDDKDANRDIITPYLISSLHSDDKKSDISKIEHWNKLYPHQNFLQILAIRHSESGNYKQAHANYHEIIVKDPQNREVLINDAILLYKHLQKYKESLATFDRVESASSTEIPNSIKTIYSAHRASVLLLLDRKKESFQYYIAALKLSENSEAMIRFIGSAFQEANKVKELADFLQLANVENPGSATLHAYLGELYSDKLNDQRAALESFADAITLDPGQSHYYNLMGLTYYKMDEIGDALKLFSAAVKIDPFDSTAKYNEACALARTGKQDLAVKALASAIELDPKLRQTAASDVDFSAIADTKGFMDLLKTDEITKVAH